MNKRDILLECIDTVKREAVTMAERGMSAEQIQASTRAMARAFLDGSHAFSQHEVNTVVESIKVGERATA